MTRMNVFIVTDLEILVLKLPRINRTDHKFLNGSRIEKKKKFIISPHVLKKCQEFKLWNVNLLLNSCLSTVVKLWHVQYKK